MRRLPVGGVVERVVLAEVVPTVLPESGAPWLLVLRWTKSRAQWADSRVQGPETDKVALPMPPERDGTTVCGVVVGVTCGCMLGEGMVEGGMCGKEDAQNGGVDCFVP